MPSNGDGSSDNGPIEGHEILHGTSGNETLQHTKKVAPMPEVEVGDSLPGMGAGGVADVVQGDSEEFGTNEPKKDPLDDTVDPTANIPLPERDSRPDAPKRQKTVEGDVSTASKTQSKHAALNKDEVAMSSAGSEAEKREARADRRADALEEPKDKGKADKYGGHADVEALHGQADSRKGEDGAAKKGGKGGDGDAKKGGKGGKGDVDEGNDLEKVQREQAKKFGAVNLENE
ncbi:hypothetical protein NX059_008181 [Plenodomus lindquistii]|nr:hypothetical protein NX059_008181 [Plenodomus lindquistii]